MIESILKRGVLPGLLALTNRLTTQDEFLDTVKFCSSDPDLTLDDALLQRRCIDEQERHVLRSLAELQVQRTSFPLEDVVMAMCPNAEVQLAIASLGVGLGSLLERSSRPPLSGLGDDSSASSIGTTYMGQRFRILNFHARGGLGEVMQAEDAELNRSVALKQIRGDLAHDPRSRSRFVLEARITGMLEHTGVVPIYALGQHPDGRPYYAMRLVHGETLLDAITRLHWPSSGTRKSSRLGRNLAFRELVTRFVVVCETVQFAHDRHILHRDIKPENIMLSEYGETLLVDWGLAKIQDQSESTTVGNQATLAAAGHVTRPGQRMGTPGYMSPEQESGRLEHLGPSTDIYSLGATLLHLLTGQRPDSASVQVSVPGQQPVGVRQSADRTVPAALRAACAKAMQSNPQDRYESAQQFAEDIRRWLADEPVSAWREPLLHRLGRNLRKHPGIVWGLIFSALAVVLALVAIVRIQAASNRRLQQETISKLMQRGDFKNAMRELDSLLHSDRRPSIDLRLQRVEALDALLRPEDVRRELHALGDMPEVEDVAMFQLWKGDIFLLASADAHEAVQRAIDLGLPQEEESYARGLISRSTPEMIEHFQQALKHKSFHIRALRHLVLALIFSARHEEASQWLDVATFVFLEDATFPLLRYINAWWAGSEQTDAMRDRLQDFLSPEDHQLLQDVFAETDAIRRVDPMIPQAAGRRQELMDRIIGRLQAIQLTGKESRELLLTLHVTPPFFSAYQTLVGAYEGVVDIDELKEAAKLHPDAVFHYLIGKALQEEVPRTWRRSKLLFRLPPNSVRSFRVRSPMPCSNSQRLAF
jgi:serine/threonine protein kinase